MVRDIDVECFAELVHTGFSGPTTNTLAILWKSDAHPKNVADLFISKRVKKVIKTDTTFSDLGTCP